MKAELIFNPFSGQVVVRREIKEVITFLQKHGWCVGLSETTKPLEATLLTRRAVEKGAETVIAAGGDGTVNEVANGLVNTGVALGVLPIGTTNSWALQMGIPALNPMYPGTAVAKFLTGIEEKLDHALPANYYRKAIQAAAQVLVEGQTVSVDVGEIAGRYFLMWAGIGLDAAIIESISAKEKKALGSWAYVFKAIGSGLRYDDASVQISMDGTTQKVDTPLIVVSNIQLYGGVLAIGAKARVNDGKLDVCIFKGNGFFTFVDQALKVLSHRHMQDPKVDYYQSAEILIESNRPLPVHVDGDYFTRTPVLIRTLPSAIKVIVPANLPANLFQTAV